MGGFSRRGSSGASGPTRAGLGGRRHGTAFPVPVGLRWRAARRGIAGLGLRVRLGRGGGGRGGFLGGVEEGEELLDGQADFLGVAGAGGGLLGDGDQAVHGEGACRGVAVGLAHGPDGADAFEGMAEVGAGGDGVELVEGDLVCPAEAEFGHGGAVPVLEQAAGQVCDLLGGEVAEGVVGVRPAVDGVVGRAPDGVGVAERGLDARGCGGGQHAARVRGVERRRKGFVRMTGIWRAGVVCRVRKA